MSDKTTYAHGFGGMNTDTPVHPSCRAQSKLSATPGSVACPITADELLRINDLAMMVLKSRQNVGKKMVAAAQDVRAITWALCTGQKPPNIRS
jgi:hypothetical protein